MKTIKFANQNQVTLYECELKGQLSDGHWENTEPLNHWRSMCEAVAVVVTGNEKTGINFKPRIEYDFADPDLVDVVGGRMVRWVKIVMAFPEYANRYNSHWSWKFSDIEEGQIDRQQYSYSDLMKDLEEMSDIVNRKQKVTA